MPLVAVCALADIEVGGIRRAALPDGTFAALYNVDGEIYATADACTHGAASLAEDGALDGHIVECSWHFGSFDIRSGAPCASPCTVPLKTYAVEIIDGIVHLDMK